MSAAANGAYLNTPGIYTDRHQQRWAEIADAVHAAGGRMFVQLWHVGRMGHPEISGVESVAPSAIAADVTTHTPTGKQAAAGAACVADRRDRRRSSSSSAPRRAARSTPVWTAWRSTPPTAICCTSSCPMSSTGATDGYGGSAAEPGPVDRRGRRGRRRRDRRGPGRAADLARKLRRRHARGRRGRRLRGAAGPDRAAGTWRTCTC